MGGKVALIGLDQLFTVPVVASRRRCIMLTRPHFLSELLVPCRQSKPRLLRYDYVWYLLATCVTVFQTYR